MYAKTYVKVVVMVKNDLYLFDRFVELLEQSGAIVTTVEDHRYRDLETDEEIGQGVESVEDIIRSASNQYSATIDGEHLYKYLMDLYVEASNLQTV